MKCNKKYDFFAYQKRNISPVLLREIENHIAGCDKCRNVSMQVKLLEMAINEQKLIRPDAFMSQRIVAKITNRQSFAGILRPMPAFAIIILLALFVGIGIGIFATKSSQQTIEVFSWNDQEQEVIEMAFLNEN
ncbi:MAG TPA: zf-HC2 domain-containing protein [Bacteroidales bacterium]|nr:zf-HC2 domain-containing protein [Bacteroidales bacterium]